ncbi:hypothetical protein C3B51_08465 [Pseudoalteromonas rubra]|uniref:Uncharacterized protein n=1 Tax=Pseudoalteromonas rubra TaxID=43658 RepID=A0A4Q7EDG0_9GAMM|nr:hypothetical protein [Pseudoalteromonas rubra]RZM81471.1 hypothetical protein C3B51_08465 [Pseudoalteromonas rubra]
MTLSRRTFLKSSFALAGLAGCQVAASPLVRALLNQENSYHALYLNKHRLAELLPLLAQQLHLYQDAEIHTQAAQCIAQLDSEHAIYTRLNELLTQDSMNLGLINMHRYQDRQMQCIESLQELVSTSPVDGYISFGLPSSSFDPIAQLPQVCGTKLTVTRTMPAAHSPIARSDVISIATTTEVEQQALTQANDTHLQLAAIYDGPHCYSKPVFSQMISGLSEKMRAGGHLAMRLYDVQQPLQQHFAAVLNDWANLFEGQPWQQAAAQRARLSPAASWHRELAQYGFKLVDMHALTSHQALPEYLALYQKVS